MVVIMVVMTLVVDGRVFDQVVVDSVGHRHGPVTGDGGQWCGTKDSGGGYNPRCATRLLFEIRFGGRARRPETDATRNRLRAKRTHLSVTYTVFYCGRSRKTTVNYYYRASTVRIAEYSKGQRERFRRTATNKLQKTKY